MYFISLLFLTVVNTVYRLKSSESKAAESENVEPNAKAQDLDGLRMEKEAALDKLKEVTYAECLPRVTKSNAAHSDTREQVKDLEEKLKEDEEATKAKEEASEELKKQLSTAEEQAAELKEK
eukprot:2296884-Rhodomonas_salina.1